MYSSLGQLTSRGPRLCSSTSDFILLAVFYIYDNSSSTSKPITSKLNNQIVEVFG